MNEPIRLHYERPGKGVSVFDQSLVMRHPEAHVLLLEAYRGRALDARDQRILEAGAPILWFVFPGMWYDIARFHLADGSFSGWYTNLCTPFEMEGSLWRSTDLFLDHWLSADGAVGVWLDEDEYRDGIAAGHVDDAAQRRVASVRETIDRAAASGTWPPPVTRDIDLEAVRGRWHQQG